MLPRNRLDQRRRALTSAAANPGESLPPHTTAERYRIAVTQERAFAGSGDSRRQRTRQAMNVAIVCSPLAVGGRQLAITVTDFHLVHNVDGVRRVTRAAGPYDLTLDVSTTGERISSPDPLWLHLAIEAFWNHTPDSTPPLTLAPRLCPWPGNRALAGRDAENQGLTLREHHRMGAPGRLDVRGSGGVTVPIDDCLVQVELCWMARLRLASPGMLLHAGETETCEITHLDEDSIACRWRQLRVRRLTGQPKPRS